MSGAEVMALILALVGLSWNRSEIGEYWRWLGLGCQLTAILIITAELALQ